MTSKRSATLRIDVSGWPADHLAPLCAYAEYRVFTQLAAFADDVDVVRVAVRRSADERLTICMMDAELADGPRVRASRRDAQPIRAVDAAAKKLAEEVCRQGRRRTE